MYNFFLVLLLESSSPEERTAQTTRLLPKLIGCTHKLRENTLPNTTLFFTQAETKNVEYH